MGIIGVAALRRHKQHVQACELSTSLNNYGMLMRVGSCVWIGMQCRWSVLFCAKP